MTPSPITTSTSTANTSAAAASSAASASSADSLANEQVFLQLLVAQLKYQDPDSPADGTTFVTQLAEFADLEQNTQSRTDLDSISADVNQFMSSSSANGGNTTGTAANTGASTSTSSSTNS